MEQKLLLVNFHRREGKLSADLRLLKLFIQYLDVNFAGNEKDINVAKNIQAYIKDHRTGRNAFGVYQKNQTMSKQSLTGPVASFLSTLNDEHLLFVHQYPWYPQNAAYGSMDMVCLCKLNYMTGSYSNVRSAELPVIVFETEVINEGLKTENQLFSHISNIVSLMTDDLTITILGVIWSLVSKQITIKAYYKAFDMDGLPHLHVVTVVNKLYETADDLAKILRFLREFATAQRDRLWLPEDFEPLYEPMVRNTCRDTSAGKMYKTYSNDTLRLPSYNLQFITNCRLVAVSPEWNIISYPYFEGDHTPKALSQVLSLLESLKDVHYHGIVHGDIRASNIIFPPLHHGSAVIATVVDNPTNVKLIDFDFSGKEGVKKYPMGFNVVIDDGERHPEVAAKGVLRKYHDLFAVAAIMRRLELQNPDMREHWERALIALEVEKDLDAAITALTQALLGGDSLLKPTDARFFPKPAMGKGTGAPPWIQAIDVARLGAERIEDVDLDQIRKKARR